MVGGPGFPFFRELFLMGPGIDISRWRGFIVKRDLIQPPVVDPSKRARTTGPALLARGASFILAGKPEAHPELGEGIKVRIRPLITTKIDDGKINKIAISGRTPSPFGKAMGDHTVAWQAVVDELHARLYGQTLGDAAGILGQEHDHASGWMKTSGTPGKLLLRELDDVASRWLRLEDATYHATKHLDAATSTADESVMRRELGLALAYHLAFVNYLPFETVEAKSALGSHGSAEGRHRATLVAYEQERRKARLEAEAAKAPLPPDDDTTMQLEQDPAAVERARLAEAERARVEAERAAEAEKARIARVKPGLTEALWALFDFKAALRASHLEYALVPSIATGAKTTSAAIDDLCNRLIDIATAFKDAGTAVDASTNLDAINKKAAALHGQPGIYEAFRHAAALARDYSKELYDIQLAGLRSKKAIGKKIATNGRLTGAVDNARQVSAEIEERAKAAPDRAARVLSALLRRHLTALAAAYPNSVRDSGVLLTTPAASAYAKLAAVVQGTGEYTAGGPTAVKVLTDLKDPFIANFGDAAIEAAAGEADAWIIDAGNSGLVVTWNAVAGKMDVNGRAAAPEGVAGMGSHTTAWVLECLALNAIIGDARLPADILTNLREAVLEDLDGPILELDELLPAAQLEGDQLISLFQKATDVLNATAQTDPGVMARSFLEFRNLLPFATVDEGSRGGHAEDAQATMDALFDKGSLKDAAGNIVDALKDATRAKEIAVALEAAAKGLRAETKNTGNKWPDDVTHAAEASVRRLARRSRTLGKSIMDKALDEADADRIGKRIYDTRWAEHQQVFALARPRG